MAPRDAGFIYTPDPRAGMAKLVDAADSKSAERKLMSVRFGLPAPAGQPNTHSRGTRLRGSLVQLTDILRGGCDVFSAWRI